MLGMTRVTLLILVVCVCFMPCYTWRRRNWARNPIRSFKNIAAATRKIFDKYHVGAVYCNYVCNEYEALCVPAWLDPGHEFNHCMNPKTAVSCALCLNTKTTTTTTPATTVKSTHPTHQEPNEKALLPSFSSIPGVGYDFCTFLCNNFVGVCLPDWLDPRNQFNHCDLTRSVGSSSWECIFCLESQMFATPSWPDRPTTTVESTSDECVQECYCQREIVIRMEAIVDSCDVGQGCGDVVPTDIVYESDNSTCACEVSQACDDGRFGV